MFKKRGPGRPPKVAKDETTEETLEAAPEAALSIPDALQRKEERIEEKKAERAQRRRTRAVGNDHRQKLGLSQDAMERLCPSYELRWTNDVGDRVTSRYNEDWDYVSWDEIGSTPGQDSMTSEGVGDRVNKVVGTGEHGRPIRAYLMKKRKEWYEDDQSAKEEQIASKEASMFRGEHEGAGNQYIPKNLDVGIKR